MRRGSIAGHTDHSHKPIEMNRRAFGSLLGTGICTALLTSHALSAEGIEALALTCIDYRLVGDNIRFLDSMNLTGQFDQVALAGASLAAVSPKFPSSNTAFWDHVTIAKELHHIRKVIFVDHRDCGAYRVAFGGQFADSGDAEVAQHKAVMMQAKAVLAQKHPDLGSEFYLMALDGRAAKIV